MNNSVLSQNQKDIVKGNLIQFNDNGFWCWFQDERAVVDTKEGKIVVGSAACPSGYGGTARRNLDEVAIFDLSAAQLKRYALNSNSQLSTDDHNAPGIVVRPDGKYLAIYSAHYDYYKNRYRIFDGSTWSTEQSYDWTKRPGGTDYTIAYNNIYYLSDEGRMYNFTRANHRTPNFIISDDIGDNWTWGGQLTTNFSNSYNKGYYKYWGNGKDRIDFIFTEQHPRDTLTSIYHGYIKGGKAYDSFDKVVDPDIYDTTYISQYLDFTKIFGNGTKIGNNTFYRCWTSDLMRYDDGTITAIITARVNQFASPGYPDNSVNPQHAFIFCRFDGQAWSYTFLDLAGFKFYSSEGDYVGLGALCPNDPNTLYISSPYDPRDTTVQLPVREIFKGVTADNGATWSWSAITENSSRDNMRPIVPLWDDKHTVLLWCRGSYFTAQSFDAAVVGIIENKNETVSKMYYVDASTANTTLADGTAFIPTGPDVNSGKVDNLWHQRLTNSNGGDVFTSSEINGEDCPKLKTSIILPKAGSYDIWVNFWGNPSADWRIIAGLDKNNLQVFRSMACKEVEAGDHADSLSLTGTANQFLYQAYVGRVDVQQNGSVDVFIDDESTVVGTGGNRVGDVNRTWYDGISYAEVNGGSVVGIAKNEELPVNYSLDQNYPNPFNPTTVISYQIPTVDALSAAEAHVTLKVYDLLGREIITLVNEHKSPGNHKVTFDGSNFSSGVYFYTLRVDNQFIQTKKMMILK